MNADQYHASLSQSSSRRNFLKLSTGAAAALGAAPFLATGLKARSTNQPVGRKAKNVILLVSDGMSMGTFTCADYYGRLFLDRESEWLKLQKNPLSFQGLMDAASADSHVTDSAAAGSAWGCGHRVPNGSLNMGPKGENFEPILVTAKRHGYRTGLVTTTRISHATPASFVVNHPRRWDEDIIAQQIFDREVDLLLGGGAKFFSAEGRKDEKDLLQGFIDRGYTLVRSRDALRGLEGRHTRLVGLFDDDHLPYHVDWLNQPELSARIPNLAEMTKSALGHLGGSSEGFLLQIEAARVDHAAHVNCTAGVILDQIAFDEAVAEAVKFAEADGETLVIVTTDHGNASPGLFGVGPSYRDTNEAFDRVRGFKVSMEVLLSRLRKDPRATSVLAAVEAATGITLSPVEAASVARALVSRGDIPYIPLQADFAVLAASLANHTSFAWAGMSHTNELCPITTFGPGADLLPGYLINTDVNAIMKTVLGMA
jgi:alkaline phosphatase